MKKLSNMDYVELYANRLKHDNRLFKQQKMLIESQLKASSSVFRNRFAGENFKEKARTYLRSIGLLQK